MKPFIFFIIVTSFCNHLAGQIIKGKVLDKETLEAIGFAQIYFDGTSVGTYSDTRGNFTLDVSKYSYMPLAVSAPGYETIMRKDFLKDSLLVIYLIPKTIEIENVDIRADLSKKNRAANLALFRKEFLGTSSNAARCRILNEDDISFRLADDDVTITASSSKPISVYNKALGYNILYYLDKFEVCVPAGSLIIRGNVIFSEDSLYSKSRKNRLDKARHRAYLGSRMHFFRSLWNDDLVSEGFEIEPVQRLSGNKLEVVNNNADGEIVADGEILENAKSIDLTGNLPVEFNIVYRPGYESSKVGFTQNKVFFEKSGFFDGSCTYWGGTMAGQRIADLLPYEYEGTK